MSEIRSFRRVFEIERRLYRIDRIRLNPGGIPVRGVLSFLALLVVAIAWSSTPVLGAPLHLLPWFVRYAGLPLGGSLLAGSVRVEGRPFHLAILALVRLALTSRRLARIDGPPLGPRFWSPGDLLLLADCSDPAPCRPRCTGPTAAVVGGAGRPSAELA